MPELTSFIFNWLSNSFFSSEYLTEVSLSPVHAYAVEEVIKHIQLEAPRRARTRLNTQKIRTELLGLSHRPILELTAKLKEILPDNLKRCFYSDSGTAAVEAALRMSLEWWQKNNGTDGTKRTSVASLVGAYHGDTLGAVRVGYLKSFHSVLSPCIREAVRLKPPQVFRLEANLSEEEALDAALSEAKAFFAEWGEKLAAFIIEPLVQGAAGIWVHQPLFLQTIADLCREHRIILIADEVAVGFGKTGAMFAVEKAGVKPDIMVLGKGLSAGYLPISAAVATKELFQGFSGKVSEGKTFFYGQTFAGNPLAAAVATANLDLFQKTSLLQKLTETIETFHSLLDTRLAVLPCVYEIRRLGMMVGIEMTAVAGQLVPFDLDQLAGVKVVREARRRGVIIRPLGNVMVLMPPLVISSKDLEELVSVTEESFRTILIPMMRTE